MSKRYYSNLSEMFNHRADIEELKGNARRAKELRTQAKQYEGKDFIDLRKPKKKLNDGLSGSKR
jgi:hypothetical protein